MNVIRAHELSERYLDSHSLLQQTLFTSTLQRIDWFLAKTFEQCGLSLIVCLGSTSSVDNRIPLHPYVSRMLLLSAIEAS